MTDQKRRMRGALTLIEMPVVIAIVAILATMLLPAPTLSQIILVTNEDNTQPGSLADAIAHVPDGYTIQFAIPGSGIHYLQTPAGGYQPLSAHDVTIDGYSQPGALANTNTILGSNTAVIKIVIDGRNGNAADVSSIDPGFASDENPNLYVSGTGAEIKGLAFLGPGQGTGPTVIGVGIGWTANNTHVSGCWFGVDPASPTVSGVHPFDSGIVAFGGKDTVKLLTNFPTGTVIGVNKASGTASDARAQFNVICGNNFNDLEGKEIRVSGNFFNVLPDGKHDLNQTAFPLVSMLVLGAGGNNWVIGTDGDGVNDAEERNIFGGVTVATDDNIIETYGPGDNSILGAAQTNMIVAGNYFGLAVDGVTRFTNSMAIVENGSGVLRFGSDLNGVSDALEGNVVYMNYPFASLYPSPSAEIPPPFLLVAAGARVSVRGNTMVGNTLAPFSYANNSGSLLPNFTNYEAPYFETASPIIPIVLAKSSTQHLVGSVAKAVGIYTNVTIDVYVADTEGWNNGKLFQMQELTNSAGGGYNGFPQGKTYLASYSLGNSFPGGAIDLNINSLGLPVGTFVTATANYSADPPGTANGRTHTSNFANPVNLVAPIVITSVTRSGTTATINWTGGLAPFTLQKKNPVTGTWGTISSGIPGNSAPDSSASATQSYYRVLD